MRRLYGINCNEEQWCVKGDRDTGYNLVNKDTLESYSISGDVVGIEQITNNEFLVYRNYIRNDCQILRLRLQYGITNVEYHNEFKRFKFLTEDLIIFDYEDTCLGAELYSISKNTQMNNLNHLISSNTNRHDANYVFNRNISLIYENQNDEYPIYLYVNYRLKSTFYSKEDLQLIIDVNSLKPVTPIYSTLRNKYFTLSDSFTLKDLVEEETYYMSIIDSFLNKLYNTSNTKSTEELLSMIEKTE